MSSMNKENDTIVFGTDPVQGRLDQTGLVLPTGGTVKIGVGGTALNIISSPSASTRMNAGTATLNSNQFAVTASLATVVAVTAVLAGNAVATTNLGAISVTLSAGGTAGAFTILSWMGTGTAATSVSAVANWIATGT